MGDHIYRRSEIDHDPGRDNIAFVKPANFPPIAPGRDWVVVPAANGVDVAVFSLLGRALHAAGRLSLDPRRSRAGRNPAGRRASAWSTSTPRPPATSSSWDATSTAASVAVLGTHTHVPTADEQILPGGTAFQCDVGMTGPYESILGRDIDRVMETTITFRPTYFEVASRTCGSAARSSTSIRPPARRRGIRRILLREDDAARLETLGRRRSVL